MFSLVVSFIGIFVGLVIIKFNYFIKEYNPSSYLLAGYFMVFSLYGIAHQIISTSANPILFAIIFNHFTPFFASIGAILYLYTRSTLNDRFNILDKRNLIHLIPFVICIIDISPHLLLPFDYKIKIAKQIIEGKSSILLSKHLLFSDINASLLRQFINFLYILCSFVFILRKKVLRPINTKQFKIINIWLRFLIGSNLLFSLLMTVYLIETSFLQTKYLSNYTGFILDTTWIAHSVIILSIFLFPNILYGLPQFDHYTNPIQKQLIKKQYKPFELEDMYLLGIDDFIKDYIKSHPYIHENYSLSLLTADSKIPTHHLNFYFKEHLNTNFNSWKNNLKINYAIELIHDGILEHQTIDAVAKKSGFKSYSNFFTVFKDIKGVTPSAYIGGGIKSI